MTSRDLVLEFSESMNLTKKDAKDYVDKFEELIKQHLMNGEKFKAFDINFSTMTVDAHTARNPRTGETINVPERRRIMMKPSSDFRRLLY